jgi:hypothetical protein
MHRLSRCVWLFYALLKALQPRGFCDWRVVTLPHAIYSIAAATPQVVSPPGVQGSGWRVDLYASTVPYERSCAAVHKFSTPLKLGDNGDVPADSHLRRMLFGNIPAGM